MNEPMGVAAVAGTALADDDTADLTLAKWRAAAAVEQHPTWCVSAGSDLPVRCGDHTCDPAVLIATASPYQRTMGGVEIGRVEVCAKLAEDGARLVAVAVFTPFDNHGRAPYFSGADLTPAQARALAAALAGLPAEGAASGGVSVVLTPSGTATTVAVVDAYRGHTLTADLRRTDLPLLAEALVAMAALVGTE